MIRACDGYSSHGEGGCGWRSSGLREADGDACPMCGGVLVEAAPPVPRQPVAGWYKVNPHREQLDAGPLVAEVDAAPSFVYWTVEAGDYTLAQGQAPTLEAAQLAAEDALRAVLVDAAAVLGLRVVPS